MKGRILTDRYHNQFALKCMKYFKQKPEWNNINRYISDFDENDCIKVENENENFHLVGMFKYVTRNRLHELNTPTQRWFTEPFELKGQTIYLSNQWYPGNTDRKYGLEIPDLAKLIRTCFGSKYSVKRIDNTWELWCNTKDSEATKSSTIKDSSFSASRTIDLINETGLIYSGNIIKRFAFSLMSKRFLILSGLAGSGKTQLALAFANALVKEKDKQMCVVSVGADWTNREPLLGFPNALKQDSYILPESGVLQLLIEANKGENKEKPYFLILDEMNMSYVERYFADFLSAMESHEKIALWDGNEEKSGVPKSIGLSDNLFIIGTINVDETTYMFSPKVLDRANVIEFKISNDEMSAFLDGIKEVHPESIVGKCADMAEDFVNRSRSKEMEISDNAKETFKAFFNELKIVNAEFGYRSATEIFRFISQASQNDDTEKSMSEEEIIDAAIVQKLLPKLHGSRKKLAPVLEKLWNLCFKETDNVAISRDKLDATIYKETADKICRMYEAAQNNGFTSFAEA